jgi:hypothetical protein
MGRKKAEKIKTLVQEAIESPGMSNDHRVDEETGITLKRTPSRECKVATGEEPFFIAMFCDYIKEYLARKGEEPPYSEFFYMPSRKTEGRLGCDMSIGLYETEFRVRTMHKMLLYEYGWCDQAWHWQIKRTLNEEDHPCGDYAHLLTLLRAYDQHPEHINPYLVLHHYYCVHDYRRLDAEYAGWRIPGFKSLLRTIIVDLSAICKQVKDWEVVVNNATFRLVVHKAAPPRDKGESVTKYLKRLSKPKQYKVTIEPASVALEEAVLRLDTFCRKVRGYFGDKWVRPSAQA